MYIPVCVGYVADFSKLTSAYNRILNKISGTDFFSAEQKRLYEEAFFIKHFAEWESMIYNLFNYCVATDTTALAEHIGLGLPKQLSLDNAHAILNGLHFTSFASSEDMKQLAAKLIVDKLNPFSQFLPPMMKYVDEAFAIRNYLVHKSQVAKKRLLKMYQQQYDLTEFIEPGTFLQERRKFDFGLAQTSQHYSFVWAQIGILSWRVLHRESYDCAFSTEAAKQDSTIGYYNMVKLFENIVGPFIEG